MLSDSIENENVSIIAKNICFTKKAGVEKIKVRNI